MKTISSSTNIRDFQIRNRIVLPPMQTGKAGETGEVTEELIKHYEQYCPDVGLIIVEHSFVHSSGKYSDGQLGIDRDQLVPGLETLAKRIKQGRSTVLIQLNHAGLKAREPKIDLLDFDYEGSLTKYKRAELDRIVDFFGEAARRASEAGFDGVEIHGAHGFLLSQFVSPITNDREDEYGGAFSNRTRLAARVVEEVRSEIGDRILSYRLGATDLDSRGTTVEEARRLAAELEGLGVDLFDVSGGLCGGSPDELDGEQGYFVPHAQAVGELVSGPVVGVGGIVDPGYANGLVEEEKVDLVAVGRAQLSDPSWATRALTEVNDEKTN